MMDAAIPAGKRRILLTMQDGTQKKVEIPDDWKITFGALVPGQKESAGKLGLRLWSGTKGKEIQHAVFTEVSSFRDMSINVMEQIEETRQETFVAQGAEEGETLVANVNVRRWVNPDEPAKPKPQVQPAQPGAMLRSIRGSN